MNIKEVNFSEKIPDSSAEGFGFRNTYPLYSLITSIVITKYTSPAILEQIDKYPIAPERVTVKK